MKSIGKQGEDLATDFLLRSGYLILERNYRHKRAEIDIISSKDKTLCFIEVKYRSNAAFGEPEDFVNENQQSRIIEAADFYIDKMEWKGEIRFDIIAIKKVLGRKEIEHLKDAFY